MHVETDHERANPRGAPVAADAGHSERPAGASGGEAGTARWPDRRLLAAGVLLVAALGVLLAFSPGLISYDTNATLWEGRHDQVRDWYTPLGSAFFGVVFDLGIGLGVVFAAQTLLVLSGLYLCLRLVLRRVYSAFAAAVICAFPPMYAQLSNLSRDTMSLGLTLLAFGLFCRATTASGRARAAAVTGALVAAVGAFLWRQNGIVVVFALVVALTVLTLRDESWRPPRLLRLRLPRRTVSQLLIGTVAGCVAALIVFVAAQASYRVTGVLETHTERALYVYDLAGISAVTDRDFFPTGLPRRQPGRLGVTPPDISQPALERRYDYANVITLYADGNWTRGLENSGLAKREVKVLRSAWWKAIRDEPDAYAANHLKLLGSQLGFGRRPVDAYYGLVEPTNFTHPMTFAHGYTAATDYVSEFVGPDSAIPLDLTWSYLLIGTLCLAYLYRRVDHLRAPTTLMMATVWLNVGLLAVVGVASSFRYGVLAVPVALVLAIMTVGMVAGGRVRIAHIEA